MNVDITGNNDTGIKITKDFLATIIGDAPASTLARLLGPLATGSAVLAPLLTAVAIGSAGMTTTAAAAAFPNGLLGLLQTFFPILSVGRKRPPWGRVVEVGTNLPVEGVVITVIDAQGKSREVEKSKPDGSFGVLLPEGTYRLSVAKPGHTLGQKSASVLLYPGEVLFTGQDIVIRDPDHPPRIVIPLVVTDTSHQAARRWRGRLFRERIRVLQARTALPILLVGTAVNTLALFRSTSTLFVTMEVMYALLLLYEFLIVRATRRTIGNVRDAVAKRPVALAVVRLLDEATGRIIATKATAETGRFFLMAPPGNYRVTVTHPEFALYEKPHLSVRRGVQALTLTAEMEGD